MADNFSPATTLADYGGFPISMLLPPGVVVSYDGPVAPPGWLFCYGQVLNIDDYPALYEAIGTRYNIGGEPAGTFRIADRRGRVDAGLDNMGGASAGRLTMAGAGINAQVLGATGGAQTVTLTAAQSGMPAHGHTGSTGSAGAHSHTPQGGGQFLTTQSPLVVATSAGGSVGLQAATASDGAHTHTVTVNNATALNASQAHTNVQPTIASNRIIWTAKL